MTILHSGSSKKFASGWQSIFEKAAAKKAAGKKKSPAAGKPAAQAGGKVKKKTSLARKKAKRG
ncbi:MAG TPA: hypothetical protein VGN42_09825 [Pirellulales bacterium]|nr:hypothetical protein [Pirellulales bacterium]